MSELKERAKPIHYNDAAFFSFIGKDSLRGKDFAFEQDAEQSLALSHSFYNSFTATLRLNLPLNQGCHTFFQFFSVSLEFAHIFLILDR